MSSSMYPRLLYVVLISTLYGCAATMEATVLKRVEFDLDCPKESIKLVSLGTKTYGASGCNKRATYILQGECSIPSSCQAIMNSDLVEIIN